MQKPANSNQNEDHARGAPLNLLFFVLIVFCCFGFEFRYQSDLFRRWEAILLSLQWLIVVCLTIWCSFFLIYTFKLDDLSLIGLLFITNITYVLSCFTRPAIDAPAFLAGVTLGKGINFFLKSDNVRWKTTQALKPKELLAGVLVLLSLAAWRRLDMSGSYYHGQRWMGLWDNPNTYGMLMGAGTVLAVGLLTRMKKEECRMQILKNVFLLIAIFMLGVGLVMSYSRGAWVATGTALLYLAWCYGKLKWRYVGTGIGLLAMGVLLFWGRTPDAAPWYLKRADLGRPSAQHRASAWRAGLEIMRDHPLGVGWNNAVSLYDKNYSPPEGGAAAITTNDYMMLGTELGIPALLCFVAYVGLCYRKNPRIEKLEVRSQEQSGAGVPRGGEEGQILLLAQTGGTPILLSDASRIARLESEKLRAACLAGALVFVVAFWFDGGLFKLPTAAIFWMLLELGAYRGKDEVRMQKEEVKILTAA